MATKAEAARSHLGRGWTAHRAEVPHFAAVIVGVFATTVALWSLSSTVRRLLHVPRAYIDHYYFGAPDTSVTWALVLGLLAAALARRKRVAWWLLTVYLVAFTALDLVEVIVDHNVHAGAALVVHLVVLAVLIAAHREFGTRVRRGAGWRALLVLVGLLSVGTMLGWGLVELFPGTLAPGQRFLWSFARVTALAAAISRESEVFDGRPGPGLNTLLGLFGVVAVLAAAFVLFRSQRADNAMAGPDESALRGLLATAADPDSLDYFATRRDKSVVFAPDVTAAITYRVEAGVCLAGGDPLGSAAHWPQAIAEWRRLCERYGWEPAVMGASEAAAHAHAEAGAAVLHLGDEAIVSTRALRTLGGQEMRAVRQAVTRARGHGLRSRVRRHRDIPPGEMNEIIRLADLWRDTGTERGFSMALGRLGDRLDGDCLLVEALTAEGECVGLLSFVPWGTSGASLDLMRRGPNAPNGCVELMVTDLAAAADGFGLRRLSLNFAVMRSVFEEGARIGAGPVLRLWRSLLVFSSRWWQLETLYRANAKYQPQWVPRFLCFQDKRSLPRVGWAAALAEGFVTMPWRNDRGDAAREYTGTRIAVPAAVLESGVLHADGSPPRTVEPAPASHPRRRPEQVRVRMDELAALTRAGIDPYPVAVAPTHTIGDAAEAELGATVSIAGRILRLRDFGGVVFAVLRDWSGDIQVLVDAGRVSRRRAREFADFDLGDLVGIRGTVGTSRNGTDSVLATDWRLDGKCLHPLPDKWRGLVDPESRIRQRCVDLVVNESARILLRQRSAVIGSIRDTLGARGYLEVETPILQQVHGGANAAPFHTHINAYNLDLYLRIAPELYLKRLCVAGIPKVFELGRAFRNEGADSTHNPEFTILEAYAAYGDYEKMMELCQDLVRAAAIAAHGRPVVRRPGPDGTPVDIDISGPWPVTTMHDAVGEVIGYHLTPQTPASVLRQLCDERGVPHQPNWDAGALAQKMYEHLVEGHTGFPTFYTNFPLSTSPLTRPHPTIAGVAAKWDLVAWGVELGTAYSELTDPIDQRRRLTAQSLLAAAGNEEAMEVDEDFLQALEHAMPPTGGLGLGVDRVVMLITGGSIRESLAFPLAKPHE
ncbi:bifunctional lysylphosphatidylglycerol synthetase/lysine--tRNA ligase LysX [Nocardia sp. NPDC001965]